LNSVLYKVYAAIIAARLVAYCRKSGRMSRFQHGFMPQMGTQLHVFTLLRVLERCKQQRLDAAIAFLDVTNAFGSVSFAAIERGLQLMHLPRWIVDGWCTTCTRTLACTSRRFRARATPTT